MYKAESKKLKIMMEGKGLKGVEHLVPGIKSIV